MSRWSIYTPEGVQDILFEECFLKKELEERMRKLFRSFGYFEVETPTFEFYDTFSAGADLTPQETMFKFFDQQGRIMVLRPEMTIPVARIAATKYKDLRLPIRFSYIGNAFRFNEMGGGKQKEFTQAGVEILGTGSPEADAEVMATAVSALKAAGIENFQIDVGQVEFFKGLMEETGLSEQDVEQMRALIDSKDFLGIEELVGRHDISPDLKELILKLPHMFGSVDAIDMAEKRTTNKRSLEALKNLRRVLGILADYGFEKYVSIDLGMVQSLNYYTGIIFRGFTHGVGFPVLSGGRYDGLVGKFGRECPATGFSLGINMVMMALERQKAPIRRPEVDTLVCCDAGSRKTAFEVCGLLRGQGLAVEMDVACGRLDEAKEYAAARGIGGIIYFKDDGSLELHDIGAGEIKKTSIDELLKGKGD